MCSDSSETTAQDESPPPRPPRRIIGPVLRFIAIFLGLMVAWSSLFFTSLYLGLVLVADVLGIVLLGIGLILLLLSFGPRRDYTWKKVLLAGALLAGPVYAVDALQTWEVALNQDRGRAVATAVKQYERDLGRYPLVLSDLSPNHLPSVPWCWYGVIPRPYTYGLEASGRPRLEFKESPTRTCAYDFERSRWRSVQE